MTPRANRQQRPVTATERPPLPLFAWYVGFAERHNLTLLGVLFTIMLVALGFASRLALHTDMAELLPDKHPAVVALHRIAGRQKSATNLVMLIHSPSAKADHAFADALAPGCGRWCRRRSARSSGRRTPRSPSSRRSSVGSTPASRTSTTPSRSWIASSPSAASPGSSISRASRRRAQRPPRQDREAAADVQGRALGLLRERHRRRALHRRDALAAAGRAGDGGRARGPPTRVEQTWRETEPGLRPAAVRRPHGRHGAGHLPAERHSRRSDAGDAARLLRSSGSPSTATSAAWASWRSIGAPAVLGLFFPLTLAPLTTKRP